MSRRKDPEKGTRVHMELVTVDIGCSSGHRVGQVVFDLLASDDEPMVGTVGGVRFEDAPETSDDSGRARGRCSSCGEDVQIRWSRVIHEFERLRAQNRHTGALRP